MEHQTETRNLPFLGQDDLALATGLSARETFRIGRIPLVIGRDESCDVCVADPTVSARHCQVMQVAQGAFIVRDLHSRNGTFVNGVKVSEAPLWNGARIGVGRTTLVCIRRPAPSGSELAIGGLVGTSDVMMQVRAEIARYAAHDVSVLITGESGTGKELTARAIHDLSPRRDGPFVALNCGALSEELALSEFFGHMKGAFTGANTDRRGAFERAHMGTLFLDEVGELTPRHQAALLRVLENRMVSPLGSERDIPVDVRIVAATNRDLLLAAALGTFRFDLYHRLAVFSIHLPSLKERGQDVLLIAQSFLDSMGVQLRLHPETRELLLQHSWPGNVRELRNVLERAVVLAHGDTITPREIRFDGHRQRRRERRPKKNDLLLLEALERYGGNVSATARALGMSRTTLRDRLKRLERERGISLLGADHKSKE